MISEKEICPIEREINVCATGDSYLGRRQRQKGIQKLLNEKLLRYA